MITPDLLSIDAALYDCLRNIDILGAVAPLNYREEKASFFQSNFSVTPDFVYAEHSVDLFATKRRLYNLPVDDVQDTDLAKLFLDVVTSFTDKLDQFRSIGTQDFLYDSLRYYGEPTDKDVSNAQFILHLPDNPETSEDALLDASRMQQTLKAFASQHGYECEVVYDERMIANALASGRKIKINPAARVSAIELDALAHHELGLHLVTTLNAAAQPLKILSLGTPLNTMTQEGLAILCEYLSGNLSLDRLKVLALRVMAVQSLVKEKDFRQTFLMLKEQYSVDDDLAFTITVRVYRGGGLTKDYLYLQGLHQILNAYETSENFNHLLCGKTSLDYLPIISRLVEKGLLVSPRLISPAIAEPKPADPIQQFITHAIK